MCFYRDASLSGWSFLSPWQVILSAGPGWTELMVQQPQQRGFPRRDPGPLTEESQRMRKNHFQWDCEGNFCYWASHRNSTASFAQSGPQTFLIADTAFRSSTGLSNLCSEDKSLTLK